MCDLIIDAITALERILVNNMIDLTLLSIDDAFLLSIEDSFDVDIVKIIQHEDELVKSRHIDVFNDVCSDVYRK